MALLIESLHGLLSYMLTCIRKYNSKKQDMILNTVIIMYFMPQEATAYNNLKSLRCFSFILDGFSKELLVATLVCSLKGHLEK